MPVATKKKRTSSTTSDLYWFDDQAAQRAVNFFCKMLTHVIGEMGGKPFEPQEWEIERIIKPLFGWKKKSDNTRKYRTVYLQVPRKNNKTTLMTGIGLYMFYGFDEPGAEIYNAAADKEQARISFDIAKRMIQNNERLTKGVDIFRDTVVRQKNWGRYRVLSSDAETKHGFNGYCILIDEVHAFPKRDLVDVLRTSTGSRREPVTMFATTPGYDRNSICYELYRYAKKVIAKEIDDPTFLPVIYEADEDDDPFAESTWSKSNPGYDVTIKKDYIQQQANEARANPSFLNVFKRLHLGIWTKSESVWIPAHVWQIGSGEKHDLEYYRGRDCFMGVDLANYHDLLPVSMVFPNQDGETVDILVEYWVTFDKASDRKTKNEADYFTWRDQGYVNITPGNVADYQVIRKRINEVAKIAKLKVVGYDDWNASQFAQDLASDGATINPWTPSNAKLWNAPTKKMEAMAIAGQINHMNNPVLAWNVENTVIRYNGEYVKPDKGKSKDKIDGVIASIIAIGEWMNFKDQPEQQVGFGF